MLSTMIASTSALRFAGVGSVRAAPSCARSAFSLASKRSAFTPLLSRTSSIAHFSASSGPAWDVISKADVIKGMNSEKLRLIDVREEDEVTATGRYETTEEGSSIDFPGPIVAQSETLPLSAMKLGALQMNDIDFEDVFGFKKPKLDQNIAFACRSGVRSGTASAIASEMGYLHVHNYKGSALEWFGDKA